MLFRAPKLTEIELRVVEKIETCRRNLRYAVSEPKQWTGLLRRTTFARAIRGSNRIAGYNVSVEDAIAAAEGDEPMEADRFAWAAVTGYRNALTYVLQLSEDPHFSYGANLIRSLHFMMLSYELTKHPGTWRPGSIYVRDDRKNEVVYEAPPAADIPSLIDELVLSLNEGDESPVMVRAAMGHLNLVMIHPFSDGNGRMARCLQTLILAREQILSSHFASIEEYLGRNTPAYYSVLAEVGGGSWHPDNDTHPWIKFNLTAHYVQAMTLLRRQREIARMFDAAESLVTREGLPHRTALALVDAAWGFRVRNSTYRSAAEVSQHLASRDLRTLVERGLLIPHGERRGRSYTASQRLRELGAACREGRGIDDPFESAQPELF